MTRRALSNHHDDWLPDTTPAAHQPHGGPRPAQATQNNQRLTLTIPEACRALGIGETMLRQMMRTGQLPILKIGRRVLIPRQAVEQLVAEACTGWEGSSGGALVRR